MLEELIGAIFTENQCSVYENHHIGIGVLYYLKPICISMDNSSNDRRGNND